LPVELLFSFWFFFLFGRAQEVFASMLGAEPKDAPHAGARELVAYQTVGAFIVLAAYMLRLAIRSWRSGVGRPGTRGAGGSGVGASASGTHPSTRETDAPSDHRPPDTQHPTPNTQFREMLSPRVALFGLIGCGLVILVWLWAAGMSPPVAVLEMGGYLLVQGLVMGRAMAEGGMLMAEGSFTPTDIYAAFAPRAALGAGNLTV